MSDKVYEELMEILDVVETTLIDIKSLSTETIMNNGSTGA